MILEGSHRLVERYMAGRATAIPGNGVTWGRFLRDHPPLEDLHRRHTEASPRRDLGGTPVPGPLLRRQRRPSSRRRAATSFFTRGSGSGWSTGNFRAPLVVS